MHPPLTWWYHTVTCSLLLLLLLLLLLCLLLLLHSLLFFVLLHLNATSYEGNNVESQQAGESSTSAYVQWHLQQCCVPSQVVSAPIPVPALVSAPMPALVGAPMPLLCAPCLCQP